jgi:hypothetical protein
MGFTVMASRTEVTVSQGDRSVTVSLSEPERLAVIRDTTPIFRGKCGCGCGADLYGVRNGTPKKFVSPAHRERAKRQRQAADREAS